MDDVNTTSLEPRLVLLQVSFFFVSFFFWQLMELESVPTPIDWVGV